ncbi:MAG: hypothetical protein ACK4SY_08680 [Pyrobaculum sp.]
MSITVLVGEGDVAEVLWERYNATFYIPAGRSSLMALYNLWKYVGEDGSIAAEVVVMSLPAAVQTFYENLDRLKGEDGPFVYIARELEDVMGGPVDVIVKDDITTIRHMGKPIWGAPLVVRELAPLYLYVKELLRPGVNLSVEFPEANLHPCVQVKVAEVLAKLVESGVNVAVVTHGEAFLWRLSHLARRGLRDKVKVFQIRGGQLEEVDIDNIPTLDEVYNWLYDESIKLRYKRE